MQHIFGFFCKFVYVNKVHGKGKKKFVNVYKHPEMKKESAEADS